MPRKRTSVPVAVPVAQDHTRSSSEQFEQELATLINKYSLENGSNTPDFVLAKYLLMCLMTFNTISMARENWYGKHLTIGGS